MDNTLQRDLGVKKKLDFDDWDAGVSLDVAAAISDRYLHVWTVSDSQAAPLALLADFVKNLRKV